MQTATNRKETMKRTPESSYGPFELYKRVLAFLDTLIHFDNVHDLTQTHTRTPGVSTAKQTKFTMESCYHWSKYNEKIDYTNHATQTEKANEQNKCDTSLEHIRYNVFYICNDNERLNCKQIFQRKCHSDEWRI